MAPLPQSWPSPPTTAHYNGTLQWHHVHSPKVGRHKAIAHYNGTQQWHHVHSPKLVVTFSLSIAHYNGTLQWHHVHSPKLVGSWSAKVVCRPPPLIGSKNPHSYRYLGKSRTESFFSRAHFPLAWLWEEGYIVLYWIEAMDKQQPPNQC